MAKDKKKGFKAPTSEAEAYELAREYQRNIARASRGEEQFYRREAARVPTEKEQAAKITSLLSPAYEGLTSGAGSAASNILNALGTVGGQAAEFAAPTLAGLAGIGSMTADDMKRALDLEKGKLTLSSNINAAAKRSAAREGAMSARTKRQTALADWLGTYGSFASMMPQSRGGGGSSTPESPITQREKTKEEEDNPMLRWFYNVNKNDNVSLKNVPSVGVAGGLPALNYTIK